MTAVIYARYSTDSQREESIEGQIRECTAYAEKNGFTVVKHYIDRAISAKTDNRPQFQQMIKDSERGIFDIIIVWKLDRFARNRYDSARYKTQLKRNGVKLVSATEVISAGPEGIILESVLEGYAEYYSADLAEKVVPDAIPPIIPLELFEDVQEKIAKNKKAPARHKAEESYLLTTKLYCGKCGALMFGESGVSHTGKMYTYYKCAAAKKKKTCDKKGRAETVAGRSGCQRDHETGGRRCFHECHHRQSDGAAKSGKHGFAHLRKAVEGNGSRHHQYAECHPDGHSDQLYQGTAGQAEDERRVRPVLAAPFP